MPEPARKVQLYRELRNAEEGGVYIEWPASYANLTEADLEVLHNRVFNPESDVTTEAPAPADTVAADAWAAAIAQAEAEPARLAPNPAPVATGQPRAVAGQSRAPLAEEPPNSLKKFVDLLAYNMPPHEVARILGVPLEDRGAERAGLTFNTHGIDDPIRVDSQGRIWFQDEVIKPAVPKSRMRRRVTYTDPGVKKLNVMRGQKQLDESFEVAGDRSEQREIKVTLPSYQSGIFLDPRMPFRVYVYNGIEGFSYRDIVMFYGGKDNVPSAIKTKYVNSDLAFDIRSVRDRLEQEHRDLLLMGRNFEAR